MHCVSIGEKNKTHVFSVRRAGQPTFYPLKKKRRSLVAEGAVISAFSSSRPLLVKVCQNSSSETHMRLMSGAPDFQRKKIAADPLLTNIFRQVAGCNNSDKQDAGMGSLILCFEMFFWFSRLNRGLG